MHRDHLHPSKIFVRFGLALHLSNPKQSTTLINIAATAAAQSDPATLSEGDSEPSDELAAPLIVAYNHRSLAAVRKGSVALQAQPMSPRSANYELQGYASSSSCSSGAVKQAPRPPPPQHQLHRHSQQVTWSSSSNAAVYESEDVQDDLLHEQTRGDDHHVINGGDGAAAGNISMLGTGGMLALKCMCSSVLLLCSITALLLLLPLVLPAPLPPPPLELLLLPLLIMLLLMCLALSPTLTPPSG